MAGEAERAVQVGDRCRRPARDGIRVGGVIVGGHHIMGGNRPVHRPARIDMPPVVRGGVAHYFPIAHVPGHIAPEFAYRPR